MKHLPELPRWFKNRIRTIMEHNNYKIDWTTEKICTENEKWTPVDLILREYYNNGGGSAEGFLGISRAECIRSYEFIRENQEWLKQLNYYSENGYNNWGFLLWSNYKID